MATHNVPTPPTAPPPSYEAAIATQQSTTSHSGSTTLGSTSSHAPSIPPADTQPSPSDITPSPPLPPSTPYPRLTTPIALPQLTARSRLSHPHPFLRAYAPLLTTHYSLSQPAFLAIIDALNICVAHAAPFQALDLASLGIGLIPEPVAMGVSAGLDVISGVGNEATMWWRVKKLTERLNGEVWGPRGLEMRVIRDVELLRLLGVDGDKLLRDLCDVTPSQADGTTPLDPLTTRRSRLLTPKIADLDFNVPPPPAPETRNLIDRLSAKEQAHRAAKKEQKMRKRRSKHDARLQMRQARGAGGAAAAKFLTEDPAREEVTSNVMALDESAGESSGGESDSDEEGSVRRMSRKTEQADEKAARINEKFDAKLLKVKEEGKREKLEAERDRELEKVEKEWMKCREDFEKAKKKRDAKMERRNGERMEKARKRLERLKWVLIVNKGDLD